MSSVQVITATAKNWIEALNRLTPATSGKKALPILGMFHVDPATGALFAIGKDVRAESVLADADGTGSPFLVNYSWLRDAITSTTGRNRNADVQLTLNGNQLTVEAQGFSLSSETVPLKDFPAKELDGKVASHIAVDAAELRAALSRALMASESSGYIPLLASVHFESAEHGLRMLSTDRFRLVSDLVVGPGSGESSFTLPAAALKNLVKQFKAGAVHIDVIENGPVRFTADGATYSVTRIDGDYPDLGRLLKVEPTTIIDVNRVQLLEAARVAALMSERNTPAYLELGTDGVQVRFNDGVFGPDKAPLATGTLAGEPVEIAFNSKYLLDVMSSFKGETVRIHGANPIKQFTFMDGGVDALDATVYRHALMPVRMPR